MIVLLVAIVAAAIGLVFASSNSFVLAAGSDASVEIYTSEALPKLLGLVLFAVIMAWAFLSTRASASIRVLAGAAAVVVLAVATHAVVINFKRSVLEERWLLVRFDRLTFDATDGLAQDWDMTSALAGVRLHHRRDDRSVYVFTGIGPWRQSVTTSGGATH